MTQRLPTWCYYFTELDFIIVNLSNLPLLGNTCIVYSTMMFLILQRESKNIYYKSFRVRICTSYWSEFPHKIIPFFCHQTTSHQDPCCLFCNIILCNILHMHYKYNCTIFVLVDA